ncbi:UNVERIFIED_CONTAM: Glutaredoxin-C11 [Sesamum radiatum]|uniref:Glutaredoxin-C11 n=1 Tax=Sesamum radiatum TaxID=300843 RepID=A0AAW2USU8_SESRA
MRIQCNGQSKGVSIQEGCSYLHKKLLLHVHSIKALFYDLGASPAVHELDHESSGKEMERALRGLGCNPTVPAVFIGGEYVGSAKDVISLHVDGSLKQRLINAKAIWF